MSFEVSSDTVPGTLITHNMSKKNFLKLLANRGPYIRMVYEKLCEADKKDWIEITQVHIKINWWFKGNQLYYKWKLQYRILNELRAVPKEQLDDHCRYCWYQDQKPEMEEMPVLTVISDGKYTQLCFACWANRGDRCDIPECWRKGFLTPNWWDEHQPRLLCNEHRHDLTVVKGMTPNEIQEYVDMVKEDIELDKWMTMKEDTHILHVFVALVGKIMSLKLANKRR